MIAIRVNERTEVKVNQQERAPPNVRPTRNQVYSGRPERHLDVPRIPQGRQRGAAALRRRRPARARAAVGRAYLARRPALLRRARLPGAVRGREAAGRRALEGGHRPAVRVPLRAVAVAVTVSPTRQGRAAAVQRSGAAVAQRACAGRAPGKQCEGFRVLRVRTFMCVGSVPRNCWEGTARWSAALSFEGVNGEREWRAYWMGRWRRTG